MSTELRPLDTNDRYAFAGASEDALINVDHGDAAVIVDGPKVEVVMGATEDGDLDTYMIECLTRSDAKAIANSVLLVLAAEQDVRPLLLALSRIRWGQVGG